MCLATVATGSLLITFIFPVWIHRKMDWAWTVFTTIHLCMSILGVKLRVRELYVPITMCQYSSMFIIHQWVQRSGSQILQNFLSAGAVIESTKLGFGHQGGTWEMASYSCSEVEASMNCFAVLWNHWLIRYI